MTVTTSGNHDDVAFPGEDKWTGMVCQNLGGKWQQLTVKEAKDPVISIDRSTKEWKGTQNNDMNFKRGFGLEQNWADIEDKSVDSSKPIQGLSNLPFF